VEYHCIDTDGGRGQELVEKQWAESFSVLKECSNWDVQPRWFLVAIRTTYRHQKLSKESRQNCAAGVVWVGLN